MDIFSTALFFIQQYAVMLGAGSGAFVFVALFVPHTRAEILVLYARRVSMAALLAIVLSGTIITAAHMLVGETATVLLPAYILKWLLAVALILLSFLPSLRTPRSPLLPAYAGFWFALFTLHTLAPEASWATILAPLCIGLLGMYLLAFLFGKKQEKVLGVVNAPLPPRVFPHAPTYSPPTSSVPKSPSPSAQTPTLPLHIPSVPPQPSREPPVGIPSDMRR